MKKKILSMVMAATMVLSISSVSQAAVTEVTPAPTGTPVYALDPIEANGAYMAPTIKVELSDTSNKKVVVNPYGLSVTDITNVSGTDQQQQLVNKVETIANKSQVALAINATLKAEAGGNTKIATAPVKPAEEKTNSIFAYLQMDTAADATATTMTVLDYNAKTENLSAFTTKETTKKAMVTVDKDGGAKSVAMYKIMGNAAANPTTPWTVADTVKFTIVFDFEPRLGS